MKLIIFSILLLLVVFIVSLKQEKINLKEFLLISKVVFFLSSFNFFALLAYHLFNAFNQINRLQFTDLALELQQTSRGTTSVVLMAFFLYFILFLTWLKTQSISPKKYNANFNWLHPFLAAIWFTLNTGFIVLMLNVFGS